MLKASLRLPLLWAGAQLGLLLASLEELELRRLAIKQRTWWALLWLISVLAAYLAGASGLTGWAPYLILSAALLLNLRWRAMLVMAGLLSIVKTAWAGSTHTTAVAIVETW